MRALSSLGERQVCSLMLTRPNCRVFSSQGLVGTLPTALGLITKLKSLCE